MITVVTAATKGYLHVWGAFLSSLSSAVSHHEKGLFIFATDSSKESADAEKEAQKYLPPDWKIVRLVVLPDGKDDKNYDVPAQMRIARLQGAAFHFARVKEKADMVWSVESDVLVTPNSLRVLEWALQMPQEDGTPYYDVVAGTYPNGLFLGGFGTPQNPIAEDFLPHERKLKPRLKACFEACEARLKGEYVPYQVTGKACRKIIKWRKREDKKGVTDLGLIEEAREREAQRMGRLRELIKKSPPDGNIWEVTAKHGWRRRGWMDFAYPAIGKGAVVPSDWCGLGCTLMSKRALALADFYGYEGKGTQDLFLCWHRWYPAGIRIACVPHVACDHVKQEKDEKGNTVIAHYNAYHEIDGEMRGHLRVRKSVWAF